MHLSVWEHDTGGCKLQRGNCGWPGCLPQWTWDWGSKLKDRIIEEIRIKIGGCLLQKELGQQTQPLSDIGKITHLFLTLSFSCFTISTILGTIQNSACVSCSCLLHQIQHLSLRSCIFTCWISSRGSLRRFFDSVLRMALRLWSCADSGFRLRPEILRFSWDKSRPGDFSRKKKSSLLGVKAAWLSDTGSYDQEIQPRTVWSVVLSRAAQIHQGYLSTS